ncbi:beta-propeller domain-containing protein [Alkaliphilus serpentinus]|uniref:Secreted protein containing C-terminal beta-propeller domain n=1 Tax=Alkaliphilus serpentinus TaxID=1482731 RepID=A0A833MA43_9FIRM|nr:beta-propeller domain-containing protein [Alkaliphilus serpentinus]KAB3530043.1 hypothetical protein F8153_08095 [Alkaliphilus serpentinus]
MKFKIALIAVVTLIIMAMTAFVGESTLTGRIVGTTMTKLPKVKNEAHLLNLLKDYEKRNQVNYGLFTDSAVKDTATEEAVEYEAPMSVEPTASGSDDFSETNIQVAGVDEGDIIKTDGEYIYHLKDYQLRVYKAYPAEELKLIKTIELEDSFRFIEAYLHEEQLIVIGSKEVNMKEEDYGEVKQDAKISKPLPPHHIYKDFTKVVVIDRKSKDFNILKEFEIEGNYFSSRKVKDNLYMVSNKSMYTYKPITRMTLFGRYEYEEKLVVETPCYKTDDSQLESIPVEDISYFPSFSSPEYMTVSTIDLGDLTREPHLETYIGASNSIYVSTENLYIANTQYQEATFGDRDGINESITEIHKIKLEDGKTSYSGSGTVKGRILNQFSMDEKGGYFRIATTTGEIWRSDEFTSKNHLFVLDDKLKVVGRVEDIAPTERIYSMRFMGDKAYMVTFRETDPFYVIDLKEPTDPKILGYLKIPGYSNYLHPYDENHIIGFGKEVHETKQGFVEAGMKIAVFDVSDVANPIEKFKVEIGGRGTYSELLHNHKALLFDKGRNLLAFPVTVYSQEESEDNFWVGNFEFQGAYVYNLDMESGFTLRGQISHLSKEDYMKAGSYYHHGDKTLERIVRIDNVLYTVSGGMVKATSLEDMSEIKAIHAY